MAIFHGLQIVVSHNLPKTYVGEQIRLSHPIIRWICRSFGLSPWTHWPMYKQDAYQIGNTLYVPPNFYTELVNKIGPHPKQEGLFRL